MQTIVVSHSKTATGQSGFKATALGVSQTRTTAHNAVGGLIRIVYEDLGVTEEVLQTGVGLGHHWDEMDDTELCRFVVRDLGLVTIEGP
jgi:hypothetical protein